MYAKNTAAIDPFLREFSGNSIKETDCPFISMKNPMEPFVGPTEVLFVVVNWHSNICLWILSDSLWWLPCTCEHSLFPPFWLLSDNPKIIFSTLNRSNRSKGKIFLKTMADTVLCIFMNVFFLFCVIYFYFVSSCTSSYLKSSAPLCNSNTKHSGLITWLKHLINGKNCFGKSDLSSS